MTLFKKRVLAAAISSLVMFPLAHACTSVMTLYVALFCEASGCLAFPPEFTRIWTSQRETSQDECNIKFTSPDQIRDLDPSGNHAH